MSMTSKRAHSHDRVQLNPTLTYMSEVAHTMVVNLDEGGDFLNCLPSKMSSHVAPLVTLTAGHTSFAGRMRLTEPRMGLYSPFTAKLTIGKSV
mmetsp:Transcript_9484/g.17766  ORF Transcript_9484/g.17766 Transcript_9484/m.17766 type:complete len:93 (-) Transcript_9484:468-746(-)